MNSPEAEANAAIINELKKFMNEAVLDFSEKSKYVREAAFLFFIGRRRLHGEYGF